MGSEEDFNFDKAFDEDPTTRIAMGYVAKLMVPLFQAFRKEGLSLIEAATLTAAYSSQMGQQGGPEDDLQ